MSYSVDEKVKYNAKRKTPFGYGYIWGVRAYRKYVEAEETKKRTLAEIADYKQEAKKKNKSGECAKGYLCGVRDAAKERKARTGK